MVDGGWGRAGFTPPSRSGRSLGGVNPALPVDEPCRVGSLNPPIAVAARNDGGFGEPTLVRSHHPDFWNTLGVRGRINIGLTTVGPAKGVW